MPPAAPQLMCWRSDSIPSVQDSVLLPRDFPCSPYTVHDVLEH
jgi:hypothetical protein